jgi:hypothetical protein
MSQPATDWKEELSPGEDQRFLAHAEYLRELQGKRGGTERGLHVKPNLALEAELAIRDGLPEQARHGLGAHPARYRAYVRVSNGTLRRQHDKVADIRGFAVKVVGVEGKKLIPGMEDARTQDFLCIQTQAMPVRTADEFLGLVKAMRGSPLGLVPRLMGRVGVFPALRILARAGSATAKPVSVACTPYYSAAALCWGPYAVRVSFQPQAKVPPGARPGDGYDYLGDELAARVRAGPVSYDFCVQFYTDPKRTPIEAHDTVWQSPWVPVGTLTLLQQDPASERGHKLAAFIEAASFDPWHALVEHRPLGNMMRARNHAYRLSTQQRGAAGEPDGSETF